MRAAQDLFQSKQYGRLKEMFASAELDDIAAQWTQATLFERVVFYKLLSVERAEEFFGRVPSDDQIFLLSTVALGALGPVLDELGRSRAEMIFHGLPGEVTQRMRAVLLKGT